MKRSVGFITPAALALASGLAAQSFTEVGQTVLDGFNVNAISASLADVDNDGDLDILFQGGSATTSRRLLINNLIPSGTLTYSIAPSAGGIVANDTSGWSAAWADYDSDGLVDVFLGQTNSGSARGDLFRNQGSATFLDVSSTTINDPGFHQNTGWADMDNDGDLDLVIAMEGPEQHEMYLQGDDGSFTQSGQILGLHVPHGTKAYGMAIGDPDEDGDLDIYLSTCQGGGNIRNNYFENQLVPTGTLGFIDIADDNGTQYMDNSYHVEFVDLDDDSDLDLFLCGADQFPSKIFRNDGEGRWTDIDTVTGNPLLSTTGGDLNGARAVDYDNDGDLDLFFHDHASFNGSNVARLLFRNDGNWTFTNVTTAEGLNNTNQGSYDSVWGDVDNDGDLDLVATTSSTPRERLFLNNASANGNGWLIVTPRMPGTKNTRAIGTKLYATINKGTPNERTFRRDHGTNLGTFNQSDVPVHFGLGGATVIDELRVVWPGGQEDVLRNVAVNQRMMLEPAAAPTPAPAAWMIY